MKEYRVRATFLISVNDSQKPVVARRRNGNVTGYFLSISAMARKFDVAYKLKLRNTGYSRGKNWKKLRKK